MGWRPNLPIGDTHAPCPFHTWPIALLGGAGAPLTHIPAAAERSVRHTSALGHVLEDANFANSGPVAVEFPNLDGAARGDFNNDTVTTLTPILNQIQ